ncbi:MAG: NAD(+) synthase, partial [Flavobacteriaceae bacterium]|nr:NAD(+) synthase [Flavobacteriaceae bacterium]
GFLKKQYPNVTSARVNLTDSFEAFKMAVNIQGDEHNLALSLANTRSRLRMLTLYYYAGIRGMLVAGTGNKVEDFGVGFFTKYGDGGVDVSPIADLMKSEVYALAEELDIPRSIQQAVPSDGLFDDDRSDEDQIGASYDELEWAMRFVASGEDMAGLSKRQVEVLTLYQSLNRKNQHKMNSIPLCKIPKIWK